MNTLTLTIVGNLTDDPELRFTPTGTAVCKFRVAHTPRTRDGQDSGQWKDGEPTFLDCTIWRQAAENVAESLTRGARVIVTGRLRTERWDGRDGEKRSKMVLDVDAVGPELSFATAKVTKLRRANGNSDDQWASAIRTRSDSPGNADQARADVDEPPF
jgi:single-strand DNA-binding protein